MARLFTAASSMYLENANALASMPFTLACWFRTTNAATDQTLMGIAKNSTTTDYHHLMISSNNLLAQSESAAGGSSVSANVAGVTADVWHHGAAVFASATDRKVYRNGNSGSNTTSRDPSGLNTTSIGRLAKSSPAYYMGGRIAEAAIWSVALTANEISALAAGISPLKIRRGSLVAYWPLYGIHTTTEKNLVSTSYPMTLNNSPTQANHPPVAPRRIFGWVPAFMKSIGLLSFSGRMDKLWRAADDDLARYELFRTEGTTSPADPDPENDTVWQTFTSLPYTTPALSVSKFTKLLLCQRNKYGLLSMNRKYVQYQLDGSGNLVATPPSAPSESALELAAAGAVHVTASYGYLADAANAGDTWLIYLKTGGADPDPAVDTPTTVSMVKADGLAKLDYTSGAYANGTVVKALVRVRRTGTPNVDSTNTAILGPVTASTQGPAAPAGGAFFGQVAEQKQ